MVRDKISHRVKPNRINGWFPFVKYENPWMQVFISSWHGIDGWEIWVEGEIPLTEKFHTIGDKSYYKINNQNYNEHVMDTFNELVHLYFEFDKNYTELDYKNLSKNLKEEINHIVKYVISKKNKLTIGDYMKIANIHQKIQEELKNNI